MHELSNESRITSIDILRGMIIVVMGLDHVRDYFALAPFDPIDPTATTPPWFFTRWITHFCAPIFVFLAGLSAFIYGQRAGKKKLSRFLWTRGLWLIFIEFTLVHFGWTFDFQFFFLQVIWVIGWSMIILSLLIHLPKWFIAAFTFVIIAGHNLLDGIVINEYWWQLLHQPRWDPPVAVAYPLIPWPAVMSFGFLVGEFYLNDAQTRKRRLLLSGTLLIGLFILLRMLNIYGDANTWTTQQRGDVYTFLDVLDTTKYPPSLLYLCMTLGPAFILLVILEGLKGPIATFFQVFGRVPFFYYVMHIYVIHLLAIVYNGILYGEWRTWMFSGFPDDYTPSLVTAYVAWIGITIIMFFFCKWFNGIKKRYSYWWLKYL